MLGGAVVKDLLGAVILLELLFGTLKAFLLLELLFSSSDSSTGKSAGLLPPLKTG